MRHEDVAPGVLRFRNLVEGPRGGGERLLLLARAGDERRVEQGVELLAPHLDRVLDRVQVGLRDATRLLARLRVLDHAAAQFGEAHQPERQERVALHLELGRREQAIRVARVAGDEHRVARLRPVPVELQVRRRLRRLAAVIGAQDRHVEAPARKLEIVRVAAEGRDVALRREHEADVLVAPVLVEPVLAALVERDALAFERPVLGLLRIHLAGLLQAGEGGAAGLDDLVRRDALERRRDFRRHVLGAHQHGYGVLPALQLLLARAGQEAIGVQVVAL